MFEHDGDIFHSLDECERAAEAAEKREFDEQLRENSSPPLWDERPIIDIDRTSMVLTPNFSDLMKRWSTVAFNWREIRVEFEMQDGTWAQDDSGLWRSDAVIFHC